MSQLTAAFVGKAAVCDGLVVAVEDSRLTLLWRCRCGYDATIGANFCGKCGRKQGRDDGRKEHS